MNIFKLPTVPRWLLHSFTVAIGMTVLVLIVSSLAGYAFARLEFPYKRTLFLIMIAGLMVPEQAVFIPLFTMFADWGIHNTHVALILPRVAVHWRVSDDPVFPRRSSRTGRGGASRTSMPCG